MTKDIFPDDIDKYFEISKVEGILSYLLDSNGICRICGYDHSFRPPLEDTKIPINVIPELFGKVKNVRMSG